MKMSHLKSLILAIVVGFLLPLPVKAADDLTDLLIKKGTITKEEADSLQKREIVPFIDKITLYGDIRLREETMWYPGNSNNSKDLNRQRFRLRIGADIQEGKTFVHFRVASGSGQQVSTNQTMQSNSSGKAIFIDKAYVELKQIPDLNVLGGKMTNPFFINWPTGEIVFDDDLNPEGFAQQYALKLGDNQKVFVNLGQIILDGGQSSDAGSKNGQWLLGEQIGTEMKMDQIGFNVAALLYTLANGQQTNFNSAVFQDGNTRRACNTTPASSNCLANPFSVVDLTAALKFNAGLPILISFDGIKNLQDTVQKTSPSIKNQDTGFGAAIKLGNASAANTYEVAYEYRAIEADATLADLNDSDFGPNGGTNRKGHTLWAAYNFTSATQVKLKYFNTKMIKKDLATTAVPGSNPNPSFNRIQLDFSVKF
ncbi:MAG TPA: putative porin [Nitrospiria bacterium]|jgi:hypothetical protein|nr:putative porin [Nitrospiria bacterium]